MRAAPASACFFDRNIATHEEGDMSNLDRPPTEPVAHQGNGLVSLHPTVYRLFVVLAAVFVIATWSFFGAGKYSLIVMAVVTLFIGFAVAILADIAHIWRDHHDLREDPGAPTGSFQTWLHSDVTIQRTTVSGKHAAFMAALPVAAVAVAMVAIAVARVVAVG
jgi:hypothetical protein